MPHHHILPWCQQQHIALCCCWQHKQKHSMRTQHTFVLRIIVILHTILLFSALQKSNKHTNSRRIVNLIASLFSLRYRCLHSNIYKISSIYHFEINYFDTWFDVLVLLEVNIDHQFARRASVGQLYKSAIAGSRQLKATGYIVFSLWILTLDVSVEWYKHITNNITV